MTVIHKYLAGILNVLGVTITALIATLDKPITAGGLIQLGIILVGAIGTYLVPLSSTRWRGLWKTSVAIVAAALTAVLPFVLQGNLTAQNILVVVLAALTALGTEIGVAIRKDVVDAGTAKAGTAATITTVVTPAGVAPAVAAATTPPVAPTA